jgi:hypothetical protein
MLAVPPNGRLKCIVIFCEPKLQNFASLGVVRTVKFIEVLFFFLNPSFYHRFIIVGHDVPIIRICQPMVPEILSENVVHTQGTQVIDMLYTIISYNAASPKR